MNKYRIYQVNTHEGQMFYIDILRFRYFWYYLTGAMSYEEAVELCKKHAMTVKKPDYNFVTFDKNGQRWL